MKSLRDPLRHISFLSLAVLGFLTTACVSDDAGGDAGSGQGDAAPQSCGPNPCGACLVGEPVDVCEDGRWSCECDVPDGWDASPPDARAAPDQGGPIEAYRFAIEVSNDVPESIYVQLNGLDGQPAWLSLRHDGTGARIWLMADCAVQDCETPSGVCGAAQPMVRDITGGGSQGEIERLWDGITSVFVEDCQRREPAPPGGYTATFCWSLQAELVDPQADAREAAPGQVIDPICQDVPFTLGQDEVVYRLLGG